MQGPQKEARNYVGVQDLRTWWSSWKSSGPRAWERKALVGYLGAPRKAISIVLCGCPPSPALVFRCQEQRAGRRLSSLGSRELARASSVAVLFGLKGERGKQPSRKGRAVLCGRLEEQPGRQHCYLQRPRPSATPCPPHRPRPAVLRRDGGAGTAGGGCAGAGSGGAVWKLTCSSVAFSSGNRLMSQEVRLEFDVCVCFSKVKELAP
ncbi:uncharacterized protein LOC115063842 [Mus pahari]|uniref:uncharacterized protein LOC115063842 n=1 Tax=Mus pahari TaxID=10093 RepID=UPI001114DCF6|nr:uncharacterized protein LOC115063842 [Mus pahari]